MQLLFRYSTLILGIINLHHIECIYFRVLPIEISVVLLSYWVAKIHRAHHHLLRVIIIKLVVY